MKKIMSRVSLALLMLCAFSLPTWALPGSPFGGPTTFWSGNVTILDNVANPTAAQSYNSFNIVNANITVLLPTAVAGMSTCVIDTGTAHDIIVDVQGTDNVALVGSIGAGGLGITNASGSSTGDFVCLVANSNKWYVTTKQGTWASQ